MTDQHSIAVAQKPNRPIRVLLWSPGGSGEHYHGPGSFSYRLYSTAESKRFEITLAHGSPTQARYSLFREQHLIHPLTGGAWPTWRFLRKADRWIDSHHGEFDIMHGLGGFHLTVAPAFRAHKNNLPSVVFMTLHRVELTDKPGLRGMLGLAAKRREMVKQIEGVIAMSQAIYDELIEIGVSESRIARIPMGVDTTRFHPPRSEQERSELRRSFGWRDLPTLVFVGGISSRKRPHLLLEAIGLLKKMRLECQLALVGPDQEPGYCEQMKQRAKELGIEDLVIWFGFSSDVAPIFRACDFFGLPSLSEGMPAALVEALATGLPSIVTAISGTTDLVESGVNGCVIEPDAQQIADALAVYLRNPSITAAHRAAAVSKVAGRFSASAVLGAYERMFKRIIAGGDAAE
ncbi:MAG TPA: glycosyltransferase family 4 protein [Phycisphaerales bacterium]|nr:glycosyltransferase family 4 protein [Phycisphaerales bacterium]